MPALYSSSQSSNPVTHGEEWNTGGLWCSFQSWGLEEKECPGGTQRPRPVITALPARATQHRDPGGSTHSRCVLHLRRLLYELDCLQEEEKLLEKRLSITWQKVSNTLNYNGYLLNLLFTCTGTADTRRAITSCINLR